VKVSHLLKSIFLSLLCLALLLSGCSLRTSGDKGSTDRTPTSNETPAETPPVETDAEAVDGELLDIVDISKAEYSYSELSTDLSMLEAAYPNEFSYSSIGMSADGRNIYAAVLGNPDAEKQILVTAGIHAREYLTPLLVMKQLEFCLYNYHTASYDGVPFSQLFENCAVCILPMCNPDGISLVQFGLDAIRTQALRSAIKEIYQSDVKLGYTSSAFKDYLKFWKANARGVDLNRNFDTVDWESVSYTPYPCFKNYKGESPLSEPEAKAMVDYARALKNPILSLAIHSQGEILYFDCGQDDIHPSLKLAYEVRNVTGYAIKYETRRDAAFDDWCIKELGIPSVTVETGKSDTLGVLSISQFEKIWKDNRDLWLHMLKKYSEDAE